MLKSLLVAAFVAPAPALACDPQAFAAPYAAAYLARQTFAPAAPPVNMAEGICQQDALLPLIEKRLGPVVGYKAAATSLQAQAQLGLTEPVLGVLTRDMLRPDGATVAVTDGARLIVELDLLARVGPDGVDGVSDRVSALDAIDAFVPFVELGDLMLPDGTPMDGPLLQAMNGGARLGVMGAPVPRGDMTPEDLEVVAGALTLDGDTVAEAPATALLGHPLDAVLWIVNAAKKRGIAIHPGDVLSLGSMGRFVPARPAAVTATYKGLDLDDVSVHLTLR